MNWSPYSPKNKVLKFLFGAMAAIFGSIVFLRNILYDFHLLKVTTLSKPVVSVGNISVGGTGKTPFVEALITQLEGRGLRVAVLTRGYGRDSNEMQTVNFNSRAAEVGDEPKWLFSRHPMAAVVVSADRVKAGQSAYGVDVFILDDGMQHRKVHRNFEITLLDASQPFRHYTLLPEGRAREPWSALRRSDLVILTKANQATPQHLTSLKSRALRGGFRGRFIVSTITVEGFYDLYTQEPLSISSNSQMKVFLVSGIGNPKSFESLIRSEYLSFEVIGCERFPDHVKYTHSQMMRVYKEAEKAGADMLLLTEKDAVKWLEIFMAPSMKGPSIGVVRMCLKFEPSLPDIYDLVIGKRH